MKIYVIQIDMADEQGQWENAAVAYRTLERAEQQVEWMKQHYGIEPRHLRIETLELV